MGTNCYWCQKSSEMASRAVERSIAAWRRLSGQPVGRDVSQVERTRFIVPPTRRFDDRKGRSGPL